jgi:hypothetical protein
MPKYRQCSCSDPHLISNVEKWEANHPPPPALQTTSGILKSLEHKKCRREGFEQEVEQVERVGVGGPYVNVGVRDARQRGRGVVLFTSHLEAPDLLSFT